MPQQYTRDELGTFQVPSSYSADTRTNITNGFIYTGYGTSDGNNCTYKLRCATVRFPSNGTVRVQVYAGPAASVQIQVARLGATLDSDTGEVSPRLKEVTRGVSQDQLMTLGITEGVYEFYIRLAERTYQTSISVEIVFSGYDHKPWGYKDLSFGARINTTTKIEIPKNETSTYTLYRIRLRTDYSGSGSFLIDSTGQIPPIRMYVSTRGDEEAYSQKSGELYSQYLIAEETSRESFTVQAYEFYQSTKYLWIRFDSPDTTAKISLTIYPPGDVWSTYRVRSLDVPSSGYTQTYSAGSIAQKTMNYIVLKVGYAGTYQFKAEGQDLMYGYLVSEDNFSIDSNGFPTSDSSIIGKDTGDSAGFAFSAYIGDASKTYYLMFRTTNGVSNSYQYTISINPVAEYYYTEERSAENISGKREVNWLSFGDTGTYYLVEYFKTTYNASGTVTVTTNNKPSGLVVYMTTTSAYGYNSVTGAPYINSKKTEAVGNSTLTFNVVSGKDYYIWVRTTPPNTTGSFSIVTINWKQKSWVYEQYPEQSQLEQVTTTGELSLSEKTGAIFALSFKNTGDATLVLQGMSAAKMYVTEGNYGFNSNGVPYANRAKTTLATASREKTITGVITNQTYYVWVSPLNSTSSGTATVTITPPVKPVTWLLTDRTGDASTKDLDVNLSSKWVDISAAHTVKYAVSFTRSGMATFRSSGNHPVSAYLGDVDVDINPSNGVPTDFDVADIGDNDFEFSAIVSAGDIYYLWIKCNSEFASSGTYLTIVVPENVSTTRGYWFYVNISGSRFEWVKGTPYIGTNDRRWRESKGYVATADGWPEQY